MGAVFCSVVDLVSGWGSGTVWFEYNKTIGIQRAESTGLLTSPSPSGASSRRANRSASAVFPCVSRRQHDSV